MQHSPYDSALCLAIARELAISVLYLRKVNRVNVLYVRLLDDASYDSSSMNFMPNLSILFSDSECPMY